MSVWLSFVLAVLATWRVTHLLASEDGPAEVFVRLRRWLGARFLGKLMDCFACLSLWVAAPMAVFVSSAPLDLLLVWLALSGAACLLERLGQPPVVMQPLSDGSGGGHHDVLRSEASDAEQSRGSIDHRPPFADG
jgi:uncharacterized protein DUF1360